MALAAVALATCVGCGDGGSGEQLAVDQRDRYVSWTIADGDPAWSPDGRMIVFARELYGGIGESPSALQLVDLAGTRVRTLTWGPMTRC